MRPCPRCGRTFAEVLGAPEQACPYCGHAFPTIAPLGRVVGPRVDPVAALALAGRTLRARYPMLLLLWIPAVVVSFGVSWLVTLAIQGDPTLMTVPDRMRALGIVTPALFASLGLEFALWALVAASSFGDVRTTVARVGALVGLGFLLTFTFFAGALLLVVPFFVFFHWFQHAPAALAEGRSVTAAFEASRAFAKERRTYGWTVLVLLAWAATIAASYALGAPLARGLEAAGMPPAAAEALGSALAAWPFAPLVPLLPAAYWRLASGAPTGDAPAAVTGAPARESVKCPRCGALLPYTPTSEVACPHCSFRGRAL